MSAKGNRERGADVGRVSFVDMGVRSLFVNGNSAVLAVVVEEPRGLRKCAEGLGGVFPVLMQLDSTVEPIAAACRKLVVEV